MQILVRILKDATERRSTDAGLARKQFVEQAHTAAEDLAVDNRTSDDEQQELKGRSACKENERVFRDCCLQT